MAQLQAVMSAVVNKPIELPPITIRIRHPARD
jgi:hypothetical protein